MTTCRGTWQTTTFLSLVTPPTAIYDGDNTSNEDCYESDQSSNEKDVVMSDVVDMFS